MLKAAESVGDMDADIAREEHQLAAVEESDKSAASMAEMHPVDFPRDRFLTEFSQIDISKYKQLKMSFVSISITKIE